VGTTTLDRGPVKYPQDSCRPGQLRTVRFYTMKIADTPNMQRVNLKTPSSGDGHKTTILKDCSGVTKATKGCNPKVAELWKDHNPNVA
jgi:hypothetical protein